MSEVLAQRQVAYTGVEVREICLPDPSCFIHDSTRTYHAVMVYRDTVSYGRVTCYDQRGDCYLDLAASNFPWLADRHTLNRSLRFDQVARELRLRLLTRHTL